MDNVSVALNASKAMSMKVPAVPLKTETRQKTTMKPAPNHAHHASALSRSLICDDEKDQPEEKQESHQVNISFLQPLGDKLDDIADNIEEDVNNTERIGYMLKVDCIRMEPSRPMRAKSEKESWYKRKTQDEISTLKRVLERISNEKDSDKRFSAASAVFTKVIATDKNLAPILKGLKKIYEERISMISQKVVEHEQKMRNIANELVAVKKENAELKDKAILIETQKNYNTADLNNSTCSKRSKQALLNASSSGCRKIKGVAIPKLDLSRLPKKFHNEKLIVVPTKGKEVLFSSESENSDDTEIVAAKTNPVIDNTFVGYHKSKTKDRKENKKLDRSMGPHAANTFVLYN